MLFRSAELTRSLLAFSRQQPLDPVRTHLNDRVSSIAGLLARTLGENIEISTALASDLWPVRVDAVRFDSCLVNLANNARDAMPRGGTLRITTRNARPGEFEATADVAAGDYVAVDVADSGQGIAAESLAQVFDPFYTTKGPGHGTGLGLSMVYGFVKQSKDRKSTRLNSSHT